MILPEKIPSVIDYSYSGLSIAFQTLACPLAHHNLGSVLYILGHFLDKVLEHILGQIPVYWPD